MFVHAFVKLKFSLFLFLMQNGSDIIGKLNGWTLITYKTYVDYFLGGLKYA